MRLRRLFLLLACGLSSCHASTSPDLAPLVGDWAAAPTLNRDGTTYVNTQSFRADHSYVRTWQDYGPSGTPRGDLLAYVTIEGTFTVRGDSLFLRSAIERSWSRDFFGGAVTVSAVDNTRSCGGGGARFEIIAATLILHYLSCPADAPVETSETLYRTQGI